MAVEEIDVDALVAQALAHVHEVDAPAYWDAVHALRVHGGRAAFERARELATSADAGARELAADVLAQLGAPDRPFAAEAIPILRTLLDDPSLDVVCSTISALGHTPDPESLPRLLGFASHPDDDVRYALATALEAYADTAGAVDTLIALTHDGCTRVRDWATFALGSISEADTPAVRDALAARLDDEDPDTAQEAVVGLAARRDPRVVPALARVIDEGSWGECLVGELLEAAAALGDPALAGPLSRCEVGAEHEAAREAALAACGGAR